MDISYLFNKFAGKEVKVKEEIVEVCGYKMLEVTPDANDPVLAAIKKTAEDNNLQLRVFFPGWGGTCDIRENRVNVYVNKGVDGKYRVGSSFSLG